MLRISTGKGFELEIPTAYLEMVEEAERTIVQLTEGKPKARKIWELIKDDPEVNADWDMANYIAVSKLKYNDHGEVHAKIVAANALKMLRLLLENGVLTSVMKERAGEEDDAYLIVLTAALLHDIGNQVHRENHHVAGVYLAIPLLNRLLPEIYENKEVMYEIRAHILNCIYSHEFDVKDLTEEASIIGIADGTDMTKGRGRIAFDKGNVNIHTVSALSIEKVEIKQGKDVPIQILIHMNNSAGIFQIQETLGKKIIDSPLEGYVEVIAATKPDEPMADQRIIHQLIIKAKRFQALN
ncbi:MAG: HD domain-containing protein [Candidatus Brockarchaeota archaeon]|nr:HD domain-containing protein [Candidatus Brockarchaeota archaeon]